MSLFLVALSAAMALGAIGLASPAHRSLGGAAHTASAFTCPSPPPGGDDLLGGQPSHC